MEYVTGMQFASRLKAHSPLDSKRIHSNTSFLAVQNVLNILGNGQRARQPGTLDAQEIDKALESIFLGNVKIREPGAIFAEGAARTAQLGPDAAVVEVDGVGVDGRQVSLDDVDRGAQARRVGREIAGVGDPFDIGPEAHAAAHVECQVRAQTSQAGLGGWVEQCLGLWPRRSVREVGAFGVKGFAAPVWREQHVGYVDGSQTRAVDDRFRRDHVLASRAVLGLRRDGVSLVAVTTVTWFDLGDHRVQHLVATAFVE